MRFRSVLLVLASSLVPSAAMAQEGYQTPPPALARIADAAPTPAIAVSPDGEIAALFHRASTVPLAELSREELRIAGLRIDSARNARSRRRTFERIDLTRLDGGEAPEVTGLPDGFQGDHARWSPDGARLAFTHTDGFGVELWILETSTGAATRLASGVNAIFRNSPFEWLSDSETLAVRVVDTGRGARPQAPVVPHTPMIQESTGRVAPARTYQDLLTSPHDEALFLHYGQTRALLITLANERTEIAGPGIIERFEPSPDGNYFLVSEIGEPFSWLVPWSRFPHRIEIRDRDGAVVRQIADLPLLEEVPIHRDSAPTGPRSVAWRGDMDATVAWIEARDGGDPATETQTRDELLQLGAPFEGDPASLLEAPLRLNAALFGGGRGVAISRWWTDRSEQIWRIPAAGAGEPDLAFDTSYEDRYASPGMPLMGRNDRGARVMLTSSDGSKAYLSAEGASPEGNRPFVDEWDLDTGETRRLFRSDADSYEIPLALLDPHGGVLLTRRETRETPPSYFVRDLSGGDARALTDFAHPYPDLEGAGRELIRYTREDGVELTALLHTPPGYDPASDGRLPLLVWAYPREYKSAAAAAQVRDSPQRFSFVSWGSALYWLTQGFAVMENATMPIIGEGDEEPNDSYIEQLVASGKAAVDEAVRRGVADPDRTAIAGHSYGAFMTANLLAHSDIFRAGIARSGAFNRSLTPFGFQSEQRTFWEAPEIYFRMSPFMHAHKVNEPILLIHGAADNNSGTFPIQSRRFFHALKGHGAVARLVMFPHESHGYAARESVMHTLWEQNEWLEEHVKNAAPRAETTDQQSAAPNR